MPRPLLSSLALAVLSSTSFAQSTVPFQVGGAGPEVTPAGRVPVSTCPSLASRLPKDTIVIAAGGYSGRKLNFQIDRSGHEATQFDVAVHSDKPVALLLGAYEPTVWSIGWTKGTHVVAVFASGYHRQVVAGLPKGTPVITSSHAEQSACGSNYVGGDSTLTWVNPKARQVFGANATRVYNKPSNGLLDIVESKRAKSDYVTSPDVKPESFRDVKAPLAGTAGLEAAVKAGLLRPLAAGDVEMVKAHYRANAPKGPGLRPDVPPVAGAVPNAEPDVKIPFITPYRAFVVLKPFVFPAGLYGGNLATFIVPKGVPAPTGNPGHSTVIDLNRPTACTGVGCR